MVQRFIRKNPYKKRVRPLLVAARSEVAGKAEVKVTPAEAPVTENKEKGKDEEMNNPVEMLKVIVGDDVKVPKRKVKVEKKEKGLIERTESSTILLTEDNKMLLND